MDETFGQFTIFRPMQTTTTSTSWNGLHPIDARCRECIYSYVKCGVFICGHMRPSGRACMGFVPRSKNRESERR